MQNSYNLKGMNISLEIEFSERISSPNSISTNNLFVKHTLSNQRMVFPGVSKFATILVILQCLVYLS